jgi:AGZA family xanthine/uracil permease-like MFS transporter
MGVLMLGAMAALDFADYTEWVPAFLTIVLMAFTYNIGVGMTAGLLAYPVLKVGTGRATEVPAAMWWLAAMSLLFYAVYPYH